ncbi:hypothetical protein C8Q76DRAFT_752957 [Earliella scabrosa]|nr:hypothetical protein C8Q76DRAFT_752957 [Earliella scabrosa]
MRRATPISSLWHPWQLFSNAGRPPERCRPPTADAMRSTFPDIQIACRRCIASRQSCQACLSAPCARAASLGSLMWGIRVPMGTHSTVVRALRCGPPNSSTLPASLVRHQGHPVEVHSSPGRRPTGRTQPSLHLAPKREQEIGMAVCLAGRPEFGTNRVFRMDARHLRDISGDCSRPVVCPWSEARSLCMSFNPTFEALDPFFLLLRGDCQDVERRQLDKRHRQAQRQNLPRRQ